MMTEKLMKNTKIFFEISIIILCFIFIYFTKQHLTYPKINISKQDSATNINQTFINLFNAGEKQLISSLLWVQTILDSDLEHYQKNDSNNWMFLRFNTIISLDPRFYEAYLYGGQYLSVIKDDDLGAKIIYEKGLSVYPLDYKLNYNAAFHYNFELNNTLMALKRYDILEKNHNLTKLAPRLPSLIKKLKTNSIRNINDDIEFIKLSLKDAPEYSILRTYYQDRLNNLYITKDLQCLNDKKIRTNGCKKIDPFGNKYLKGQNNLFYIKKEVHK
jgi:hypothetical protein